ncbi:MAG: hypothetical protein JWL63_2260 [Rhodocyclales bacterium]|nr:hypothetical protein [Rhodocyclales bacterium]
MSIRTIQKPLPGERVVGLSPQTATEAASDWLRRPNLFPGRALSAGALSQRQQWQAGHIAERGQDWVAGVVDGLEVVTSLVEGTGFSAVKINIGKGRGLAVSGEDVVLNQHMECLLADVPVVAPPGFFIDGSGVGGTGVDGTPLPRKIGSSLGELLPVSRGTLPGIGILVLQPVMLDTSNFDPFDPCDRSACDENTIDDNAAFEDWRIGDGVRLLWYVWPGEWNGLPPVGDVQLRNALAWTIFGAEAKLSVGDALPWEEWGVPLAMVGLDASGMPAWVDRAGVVRRGGLARDARLQLAGGTSRALAANSRLPSLWQAQIEQFAEQVAATGEPAPAPDVLAESFGSYLPPVGLLPSNAFDAAAHSSQFFPAGFDIDATPVPVDQLDLAIRASAPLAPLNLSSPESVRILVPVPLQSWEPRLLITEVIDPEFQKTLDRFLLNRARDLGARQGLRVRQSVLTRALTGTASDVVAWNDDDNAVEAESISPWGPPPVGGGHRSALRAGVHQHYFEQASETMTVAGDRLFCWVYLDPANTPRTLMLQWHAGGSWEHRAYWGENLIGWGVDGTTSRARIGELPVAGAWVRLEISVASVGLAAAVIDGMAFSLFDGEAAYGVTGDATGSTERKWFCNVLPKAAILFGDEPWELLTSNDLWAPFEPTLGVLPATPAALPLTLGGHYDAPSDGLHQHFFDTVTAPFAVAKTESLFCWVYLDPINPPRQLQLKWRSDTGVITKAYWGWSLIDTADNIAGTRIGDLPVPGQWVRLEFNVSALSADAFKLAGVAFQQFNGFASFGAIGAGARGKLADGTDGPIGTERVWFAAAVPAGAALRGTWNFLGPRDMFAPSPASVSGQVQALSDLYNHPSLSVLSAPEREQIYLLGVQGFSSYLKSRADRADDIVDYGFVKVQTDIYRVRQLMLGTTAATRLAVSPSLANIAKAETATASQTQIASFITGLKTTTPSTAPAFAAPAAAPARAAAKSSGGKTILASSEAPQAAVSLGGVSAGSFSGGLLFDTSKTLSLGRTVATVTPAKSLSIATDIKPIISSRAATAFTPIDIVNASPLVGDSFVRTTTIAQRLEDPKSKEARDYASSSRYEAVLSLIRLADDLSNEDGGTTAGMFEGVDVRGLDGDGFLADLPEVGGKKQLSRPLTNFIANRALLSKLLIVPTRTAGGVTDPDEAAMFSDTTDLSDHVVALMRKIEGRIKLYRDAIAVCQQVSSLLQTNVANVGARLAIIGEDLAEARHDVGVARSLFAEETQRIADINARRTRVLAEEVKFLAFIRPRESDNLLATPTHAVDPGLIDAPVPACLRAHPDVPDELADMLRVVREAPSNWFIKAPPLLHKLDRVEPLIRTLTVAQGRALAGLATPVMTASTNTRLGVAISRVAARQVEALAPRISAMQNFNIASLANTTWSGIRQQAEQVVSFGDIADGSHGRSDVAQAAATELQNIRSIVACLHAEFSGITPVLRLEWSETLSEFDAAPNLRNLASLPRWSEIDYIDRRQMQAYVDFLFAQIEPNQPSAVALINDVVRMCLLLASHAPVDRIIAGRMARPITGVVPGIRIPLTVLEPARLRVGMQAVVYQGESIVARALVEDLGQLEVSAHVIHTTAAKVDLGDDVRIHFDDSAMVSLTQSSAKRTLFGR